MSKSQHYRRYLRLLTEKWLYVRFLEGDMRVNAAFTVWEAAGHSHSFAVACIVSPQAETHKGAWVRCVQPGLSWEAACPLGLAHGV